MARKEWLEEQGTHFAKAWTVFQGIQYRCTNPRCRGFHWYGSRGIELRITRPDFIDWYIRKAKGRTDLTIDRIDNDGHYELGNMQLITQSENTKKARQQNLHYTGGRKGTPVQIGGLLFESVIKAGVHFSPSNDPTYIRNRIKYRNGKMPDGTSIILNPGKDRTCQT